MNTPVVVHAGNKGKLRVAREKGDPMRVAAAAFFSLIMFNAAASGANAAEQFNLVCTGTMTSQSLELGTKTEPYTYTYRFDLKANKYCEGDCKAPKSILRVDPTVITLQDDKTDTPSGTSLTSETINRETGRHYILADSDSHEFGILLMKWEGQCQKAPFTGFPDFKTKF